MDGVAAPSGVAPGVDVVTSPCYGDVPGVDRVTAIIVHYRTPDLLRNCLRSLEPYHQRGLEVLVVDNDSGELAPGYVPSEFPWARLIAQDANVGYSRAVNLGIDEATGEYYLVLNPDIIVRPGALEALLESAARHPEAGIVAPKLLNPDGTLQHSCRRFYDLQTFLYRRTFIGKLRPESDVLRRHLMLDFDHLTPRVVDWVLGGAMLVRKTAVDEVGGMDERFFLYFEDVDWCYRMHRRGWRVLYEPTGEMEHHHRRESAKKPLGKSFFSHLMSVVRFYEKWSFVVYLAKTQREELAKLARFLLDVLGVNLAFLLAFLFRMALGEVLHKPVFGVSSYVNYWLFGNAVAIGVFYLVGFYRTEPRGRDWVDRLFSVARGTGVTTVVLMATTFLLQTQSYSRVMVLLFWPLATGLILALRQGLRWITTSVRDQRLDLPRVAVAGNRGAVDAMRAELQGRTDLGFEPIYLADFGAPTGADTEPESDRNQRFLDVVRGERIASVLFVAPSTDSRVVTQLVPPLARAGVRSQLRPEFAPILNPEARVEDVGGSWTITLGARTRFRVGGVGKRTVDVVGALLLLVLLAPPNLIYALGRLLSGRRPLTTVEERFVHPGTTVRHRMYNPRPRRHILSVVLLDHYPRLLSVLSGAWSFVGVYGFQREELDRLSGPLREIAFEARPGLTGLWWFHRGVNVSPDRLRIMDVEYVQKWSTTYDLKTFLRSLTALIQTRGHLPEFAPDDPRGPVSTGAPGLRLGEGENT